MAKERSMALREELNQFSGNAEKEIKQLYEKIKQRPLTCLICIIVIVTAVVLLIALPYWRVTQFGIADPKDLAEMENSYRATLAQILGGTAVGIGIYFAWGNLTTAREGQITERFTRAVDQLGSDKLEIRLGGIYALERIANESEKDYWSIMEILTTCVIIHTRIKKGDINIQEILYLNEDSFDTIFKAGPDIQTILTVLGRRKLEYTSDKSKRLDLCFTNLQAAILANAYFADVNLADTNLMRANLTEANLVKANLNGAYLIYAFLRKANLEEADIRWAHLEGAFIEEANLTKANLNGAYLTGARFILAHLEEANFEGADLRRSILAEANLKGTNLEGASFEGTNLKGAKNLTIDQLSKAKTLYKAQLDPELEKPLREKYPALFEKPKR